LGYRCGSLGNLIALLDRSRRELSQILDRLDYFSKSCRITSKVRSSRCLGPVLTSPLAPRGEICPLGRMFIPLFTPRGEYSLLFRRMEGRTENFTPWGQNSPLGDNFAHGGQSFPLEAKLRMGLRMSVGRICVRVPLYKRNSCLGGWV
jgi:hypothetical protein